MLWNGRKHDAAPPYDFFGTDVLPILETMGPKVQVRLEKYGFYPAGGGRFVVEIEPSRVLSSIELGERGHTSKPKVQVLVANLSRQIAQREAETVARLLDCGMEQVQIIETRNSSGPGNVVMVEVESTAVVEVFTAFGTVGVSAEKVGIGAAEPVRTYLASKAAAGDHLADQLLLPMALSGGDSFVTASVSSHCHTNAAVISEFLPVLFEFINYEGFSRIIVKAIQG